MKKGHLKVLIISLVIVAIVAFLGSLFTNPATSSQWYKDIRPSITPPNFIFPIAWTILFILIGISLYFAWINSDKKEKGKIALVFGINFVLNILWSILYFGLRNFKLAFVEIIILWISILTMILVVRRIDKKAAWMLVPYLVWVAFASVLNLLTFI
jgi:translocator protein